MLGTSINDIHDLPDPKLEQDAMLVLMLCSPGPELNRMHLELFMIGNNLSKARVTRAVKFAIQRGWMIAEGGLKITDFGRSMV